MKLSPQFTRNINSTIALRATRTTTYHPIAKMASSSSAGATQIESLSAINTAAGVELSSQQKTLVGCVLDLFQGKPSKDKLALWADDADFVDPLCIAKGRKQYEAQWYGLAAAFSKIQRQHVEVVDAGNPIAVDMTQLYTVKGIGKEQQVKSRVNIYHDGQKITKVEDKWDGKLPDGPIANAFRRLNAVTVPHVVSVPKDSAEEAKKSS